MAYRNLRLSWIIVIIFMLVPAMVAFTTVEADAKPKHKTSKVKSSHKSKKKSHRQKRVYNREKNRSMALETLENSDELAKIANYGGGEYPGDSTILNYEEGEDLNELELEDNVKVDIDHFKDIYFTYVEGFDGSDNTTSGGVDKKTLIDNITDWLGTPYRFGGTSDRAIDCSAFVLTMYKNTTGIRLPRTAREQFASVGVNVKRQELQFGDLIFFHTRRHAYVSHVGIYLGDNLFAHASSKYGVTVSSLESGYYDKRFIGAKRITARDIDKLSRN